MKSFTITELENIFAVNYYTVHYWMNRKNLKAFKDGKLVKFDFDNLNTFIQTQKLVYRDRWDEYKKENGF